MLLSNLFSYMLWNFGGIKMWLKKSPNPPIAFFDAAVINDNLKVPLIFFYFPYGVTKASSYSSILDADFKNLLRSYEGKSGKQQCSMKEYKLASNAEKKFFQKD